MSEELKGKIALVTGGSRGIGRSISAELAACGAHVYVNYGTRADAAEETVAICKSNGGSAEAVGFNVAESEAVEEAVSLIKKNSGSLDILVNNAGITNDGLFVRMKDQDWDKVIAVNLTGAFYCSRAAAKIMMRAKSGSIINISSVVGQMGNPGQASYVSSKAGLIGLTKSLARELASRNITVNAIAPGFIETDMTESLDQKTRSEHMKAIPLARYGSAEEVAALVSFLAGKSAAYITGQVIGINGGMYM